MITQERIKAFEEFLIEQERSRATVEKYVRDVRAFVAFADEREIDKALVLAYKGYLQERYATASVNSVLSSLGAFFGYCERLDLCVKRVKVFPHNLRHLFARTFYTIHKDIVRLADVLGHSSIDTTRIYTMECGEVHRRRIDRLNLVRC